MLKLKKLCDAYEDLTTVERGLLLTEKSVSLMAKLHTLSLPGLDPVSVLAGFIIGSVTADGRIREKEYLLIYPALVSAFGDQFDFATVKESFRRDKEGQKMLAAYTEEMMQILDLLDDSLAEDVITLCLCVLSIDGKVSLREKNYLRRLCRA